MIRTPQLTRKLDTLSKSLEVFKKKAKRHSQSQGRQYNSTNLLSQSPDCGRTSVQERRWLEHWFVLIASLCKTCSQCCLQQSQVSIIMMVATVWKHRASDSWCCTSQNAWICLCTTAQSGVRVLIKDDRKEFYTQGGLLAIACMMQGTSDVHLPPQTVIQDATLFLFPCLIIWCFRLATWSLWWWWHLWISFAESMTSYQGLSLTRLLGTHANPMEELMLGWCKFIRAVWRTTSSRRQVGERFIVPRSQVSAFQFMEINRSWKLVSSGQFSVSTLSPCSWSLTYILPIYYIYIAYVLPMDHLKMQVHLW